MRVKAKAYSAGTVLNALALGYGCAFALDLSLKVKVSFEDDLKECILIESGVEKSNRVLNAVMNKFGLKAVVEVSSDIPRGSGLGSSSAFLNALLLAVFKHLNKRLLAHEILVTNAKMSLDVGISYTGAFDDASASLLGGIALTDNKAMVLLQWSFKKAKAVVLVPEFGRGSVDLKRIRSDTDLVKKALEFALQGDYKRAMFYNSLHYCKAIGYPFEVVERVADASCCCGLSGNGPCFVAFGDDIREVESIWQEYGKVVRSKLVNDPCDDIVVTSELFEPRQ